MKTRTGFVSNSSSSSFVVAFPHLPQGVQEVHDLMFKRSGLIAYCGSDISTKQAASQVWADIIKQISRVPLSEAYVLTETAEYGDGQWCRDRIAEELDIPFEELEVLEGAGKQLLNRVLSQYVGGEQDLRITEFMVDHQDESIFVFEYADDDGDFYNVMEHGEIFWNLPHLTISHH